MNKVYIIAGLVLSTIVSAQIRTNNRVSQNEIPNQTPFLDASSSQAWNGTTNIGKGLVFPRVDLVALKTIAGPSRTGANNAPTQYDGMVVYNTATGTSGVGNVAVKPGFYYYENKSGQLNGGTWRALGGESVRGLDGRTLLSGATAPAPGTGAEGDFYINTATNTIYGPKTASGWGTGTSLVGPAGPQGVAGATGPQGPAGARGATGPQGPAGAAGAKGADGKSVLSGTTVPATGTGAVGDFYIDTATNRIYGPKTASGWGTGTSLVGPAGPQGVAGATGPQGIAGPAGPQGATGATGARGPEGPSGVVTASRGLIYTANTKDIALPAGTSNNQVLKWNGTAWAPAVDTNDNIYTANGTLSGNRTVTQGTNNLMFTGEGKVGFGTATPRAKVDIVGGVRASKGDAVGDGANVGYAFDGDGDTGLFAIGGAAVNGSDLILKNDNVQALTIKTGTRNVGIGTNDPGQKLEVAGGNIRAIGGLMSLGNTNIGGWLELENTLKTGETEGSRWRIYNMTDKTSGTTQYTPGLHFWAYSTSATQSNLGSKMILTDEGNLGIGLGSRGVPTAMLDVSGATRIRDLAGTGDRPVAVAADGTLKVGATLQNLQGSTSVAITNNQIQRAALTGDVTAAANSNALTIANNAVNSAKIADNSVATADLANGAVTAVKLNQMGATNGQVLKWNGTAWAPATDANDNTNTNIYTTNGTLSGHRTVTMGANNLMFSGTGNVGIGTTTPAVKLDVGGRAKARHFISYSDASNTDGHAAIINISSKGGTYNTPNFVSYEDVLGAFVARDAKSHNESERNRNGLYGGSEIYMYATQDFSATAKGSNMTFRTTPNNTAISLERMRIEHNGNVGIGTGAPSEKLEVAGNVKASNFINSSDARLKKDITNISNATATINSLRGVTYHWNKEEQSKGSDKRLQYGFIAQEVEKVLPSLVNTDEKGYKSVNYIGVIPVLVKSLQEKEAKIQELEARLEKIEKILNK